MSTNKMYKSYTDRKTSEEVNVPVGRNTSPPPRPTPSTLNRK